VLVKMQAGAFDQGAMRECFRMKKMSQQQSSAFFRMDWSMCGNYVAKRYLDSSISSQVYWDDIQLQMESKAWAFRYVYSV
jgi:elongation factor 2 kinase